MIGFKVLQPGILSLIQDLGRFGHHRIGLTNGGPLDPLAFKWANRLLGNPHNSTALEVSIGGLVLEAQVDTYIVLTGGEMPFKINHIEQARWCAHRVQAGDRIELGFSQQGARAYLAVADGFCIKPTFGSTATVNREALGGLNQEGSPLKRDELLPCTNVHSRDVYQLAEQHQPTYIHQSPLRVVKGYQEAMFSALDRRRFYSSEYHITDRANRMGYRLSGPNINVKSMDKGMLSEGITHGAIQIPADGQPIVLLNDRQTIGGYPKIGSMLSLDTARLAQQMPGNAVHFEEITIDDAHNILCLEKAKFERTPLLYLN